MKRKVNRVGQNTLTVSIPSGWAKENRLEPGNEVELEVKSNSVTIYPQEKFGKGSQKEISIALMREDMTAIRSILGGYYRSGYDLINVKYDSPQVFKIIRDSVNQLIGFDIVEKGPGSCKIKSFLMEDEENFENMLCKTLSTIKTVQQVVRNDYQKGEYNNLEELEDYRFSIWKIRDLSMRTIIKSNAYNESNYAGIIIIWSLEKINRNYKRMYRIMKENSLKSNKGLLSIYDEFTSFFEYFSKALLSQDKNAKAMKSTLVAEHIHKEHDRLVGRIFEIMPKLKKDSLMATYLLENVRRMQDMAAYMIMISN